MAVLQIFYRGKKLTFKQGLLERIKSSFCFLQCCTGLRGCSYCPRSSGGKLTRRSLFCSCFFGDAVTGVKLPVGHCSVISQVRRN